MTERRKAKQQSRSRLELRPPAGADEWDRYFDLRWRVLRAPWEQPRGSERDDRETGSIHLALWDDQAKPVAAGRVHLNTPLEAQVRYMAVEPDFAGSGLGGQILAGLENRARELGASRLVLNSRETARGFYERHGYVVSGPADTMFGQVVHVQMTKGIA